MKALGYQVLKGRGISFIDDKKVKIKGSEVDFSLMKIEKILVLNQQIKKEKLTPKINDDLLPKLRREKDYDSLLPRKITRIRPTRGKDLGDALLDGLGKERNNLLYDVMKPEYQGDSINPELLKKSREHKKRLKHPLYPFLTFTIIIMELNKNVDYSEIQKLEIAVRGLMDDLKEVNKSNRDMIETINHLSSKISSFDEKLKNIKITVPAIDMQPIKENIEKGINDLRQFFGL
jgi:hypothetical protein